MALMDWHPEFGVGVRAIDAQHRRLVEILNTLHDGVCCHAGKEALDNTLLELVAFTEFHFREEEELMRKHRFPGYEQHKREHERLTRQVIDFRNEFLADRSALDMELMSFLRQWLENHMLKSERAYRVFVQSRRGA